MSTINAETIAAARSLLFVPGDRPERFSKAVAAQPDLVIIDLEDAVATAAKDVARGHTRQWLTNGHPAVIRINGLGTPWHAEDLALVTQLGVWAMVPKAEDPNALAAIVAAGAAGVIALVETARGLQTAASIAAVCGVHRLAFGSIDLAAELGVDPTDRDALQASRTGIVVASAAAGLAAPIDGVTTALNELWLLQDDIRYARRLGMTAKLCIHPTQVAATHDVLAPTADQISWAQRVIAAADDNQAAQAIDGQMIDAPVAARAHRILAEARRR